MKEMTNKMPPQKIRVLKRFPFDKFLPRFFCYIEVGEIGEYFLATDIYTFETRNGYVPYVTKELAMKRMGWWFEVVEEDQG